MEKEKEEWYEKIDSNKLIPQNDFTKKEEHKKRVYNNIQEIIGNGIINGEECDVTAKKVYSLVAIPLINSFWNHYNPTPTDFKEQVEREAEELYPRPVKAMTKKGVQTIGDYDCYKLREAYIKGRMKDREEGGKE